MRGKRKRETYQIRDIRITPAHAGKTAVLRSDGKPIADHPRACGENSRSSARRSERSGSPPRMRGKQISKEVFHSELRITPAHAGKTSPDFCCNSIASDHPRACGENDVQKKLESGEYGSPPRMRGKLCFLICV